MSSTFNAIIATVGALAAVVGTTVAVLAFVSPVLTDPVGPAAPSSHPPPSSTSRPNLSGSSTPSLPPTSANHKPRPQPLVLKDAVGNQLCEGPGNTRHSWTAGSVKFDRTTYQQGVSCPVYTEAQSGWVDFLVPIWAQSLHIVAGITDDSHTGKHVVRIELEDPSGNGRVLDAGTARLGESYDREIDVRELARVRIRATVISEGANPPIRDTFGFAGEWRS